MKKPIFKNNPLSTPATSGVILCVLSLILIAVGFNVKERASEVSYLLYTLGIGLFITTSVTVILNYSFKEQIEKFLALVSSSQKIGIKMIYENRAKALPIIDAEADKTEKVIDILAIAGTDFFHTANRRIINKIARMVHHESNIGVRVLLLHPGSKYAIDRAIIEENFNIQNSDLNNFNYADSKLWRNIFTSLEELQIIVREVKKRQPSQFSLEVRLYETSPALLYVNVDDKVFVEQYHFGVSELEAESILRKCLGKRVPIIEYYKGSLNSQIFKSHFEKTWENSAKWIIGDGNCIKELKQTLEERWIETYKKCTNVLDTYRTPLFLEDRAIHNGDHANKEKFKQEL